MAIALLAMLLAAAALAAGALFRFLDDVDEAWRRIQWG